MNHAAAVAPASAQVNSPAQVLFASLIGTSIEFFDFYIYATAAVLVFPQLFFPASDPATATLASLATFGIAFLARPIGASSIVTQLFEALLRLVTGIGSGNSLLSKAEDASASYAAGDTAATCNKLGALSNEVNAQIGKKISPLVALQIQTSTAAIRIAIPCL